jgi:hypothetical protein
MLESSVSLKGTVDITTGQSIQLNAFDQVRAEVPGKGDRFAARVMPCVGFSDESMQ